MCVFCQIIKKEADAHIVYESDKVISFLDIEPIHDGHVLILPKVHEDSLSKIPDEYISELMTVAKKIVNIFENEYKHTGYSIMQNGGECCDFGHFHLHVFPRKQGDGFGWTYPEVGGHYAKEIADDIRQKLNK